MTFAERNRKFLEKLRNLPDKQKKIILWTVVIIAGILLGSLWVKSAVYNFSKIGENISKVNLPEIDLSGAPKISSLDSLNNK